MTGPDVDDVTAALVAIGAHGLPGADVVVPARPLDDRSWAALLAGVEAERLTGLLAAAVTEATFPVTPRQREDVVDAHVASMAGVLVLESLLLTLADVLGAAGLPFRVLKGSASAHLDYTDPALRPFADIDLLVRPADLNAVERCLATAGVSAVRPQVRADFAERFGKGFVLRTAEGLEVDVHRTLAPGAFGLRLPIDDLWARRRDFVVGDTVLSALGDEERLLHAAYHAVIGGRVRSLLALRDVAEMSLYGSFTQDRLRLLARAWGAEAVLAAAVRRAWATYRVADVTALSRWAERHEASVRDARLISVHASPNAPFAAEALGAVGAVPGLRAKSAYLSSLALPRRDFLDAQGTTRREWLARGLRRSWSAARQRTSP